MRSQRPGRLDLFVAWGGFVVLLVLHLDGWRTQRPVLRFGWLPEELGYRLVWILLAWAYLQFLCARLWREREE